MYSRPGEKIIIGASGLVVHLTPDSAKVESADFAAFQEGLQAGQFGTSVKRFMEQDGTDSMSKWLVFHIRREAEAFCRESLRKAQEELLCDVFDRKSCDKYVSDTSQIVRLLELYDSRNAKPACTRILAKHARLLALMDHRQPSRLERYGQAVKDMSISGVEGRLLG